MAFWRGASVALFTAIVTLFGGWVALGDKLISQQELEQKIQRESPYMHDKKDIESKLQKMENVEQRMWRLELQGERSQVMIETLLRDRGLPVPPESVLHNDQNRSSN